jgi:hypothetical protein
MSRRARVADNGTIDSNLTMVQERRRPRANPARVRRSTHEYGCDHRTQSTGLLIVAALLLCVACAAPSSSYIDESARCGRYGGTWRGTSCSWD